jgi:hypothetical protein
LRTKSHYNWSERLIPREYFTEDVAIMIEDMEILNTATEYGIDCDIFIHPGQYLTHLPVSFVFQKDFALREIIDYQLLKFQQSGLLKHLAKKYFQKINKDCQPPVTELSFGATFISFAILAAGIIIAIFILALEKAGLVYSKKA